MSRSVAFVIPGDIDLPTGGYAYDRHVLAGLSAHGVEAHHVALPGSYPWPTKTDIESTRRTLTTLAADTILLIDGLAFGAMPAEILDDVVQPVVALVHHPLAFEAGLTAEQARLLRESETVALAKARHVIVTSPMTGKTLASEFAVPRGRITVAEPGTDPAPRARMTGSPPQLLAVGSIVPRKGYGVLIGALAAMADLEWALTIAGAEDRSPETAQAVRWQIEMAGLRERVHMLGAVTQTQLADLYAAADLFVMPSLFEGYGMVLAEAMARGLPIVCTTGGAAAETVPDGAALKVSPGDAGALQSALRQMIEKPDVRRRIADASWRAGQLLPRWDDTARVIAEVLKGIEP